MKDPEPEPFWNQFPSSGTGSSKISGIRIQNGFYGMGLGPVSGLNPGLIEFGTTNNGASFSL